MLVLEIDVNNEIIPREKEKKKRKDFFFFLLFILFFSIRPWFGTYSTYIEKKLDSSSPHHQFTGDLGISYFTGYFHPVETEICS